MFTSKSKTSAEETAAAANSILGAGTTITGNIETSGDLRIDGTLKGDIISSAKLLIGPNGVVEGNINCRLADIMGQIIGNIHVKDLLQLKGKGLVTGDIHTTKLFIEETASFNGQCKMGASVVELKQQDVAIAVNE
jgi:cytoskeletal protein CcmA (bactofilin family)